MGSTSKSTVTGLKVLNDVIVSGTLAVTGAQTFTGAATFAGAVTLASTLSIAGNVTISGGNALVLNGATVKFVQVALSSAQILALNATPVTLIAAPGAGKRIVLHRALLSFTAGTQYQSGGAVVIRYPTGTVAAINTIAAAIINSASNSESVRQGIDAAAVQNDPLEITNATGAFTTGTGTAVVSLWYSVL